MHQPLQGQQGEIGGIQLQLLAMPGMAVEPNPTGQQLRHHPAMPVIGVGVRQQHAVDRTPVGLDLLQQLQQAPRVQPGINQQPPPLKLQQCRVSTRATGKLLKTGGRQVK
jgi:hypothetical protein